MLFDVCKDPDVASSGAEVKLQFLPRGAPIPARVVQTRSSRADADYLFCSAVPGEDSPSPGIEKTTTTKAELTSALHDAFASCNRAYDTLSDANANDTVKSFGQDRKKLGVLWFNASHNLEHYGNLVVYMRLKGIVPPSSDRKPQ